MRVLTLVGSTLTHDAREELAAVLGGGSVLLVRAVHAEILGAVRALTLRHNVARVLCQRAGAARQPSPLHKGLHRAGALAHNTRGILVNVPPSLVPDTVQHVTVGVLIIRRIRHLRLWMHAQEVGA